LLSFGAESFVFILLSKNIKFRIHGTIILLVSLYGCDTWSVTSREEQRLRVLEVRVLNNIFGLKWDGVTGEWRRMRNE
jgi:hypothetical protein